ncbi:hypothetical protein TrRE_jg10959 [Triparma retinervis]|uniref:Sulfhydryl oxidase n=1 Tax=Triparma retinervis TaxID=2557542 RepID=A0A9W7FIF0_9STRA|nr:hypothetical protein TrRE_jg10959 [Triparma retinervis]
MTLDRPSLVIFYAPWCPHCKHYKSTYEEIGERLSNTERHSSVNQLHPQVRAVPALAVSCTEHSGYCSEMEVHGYPTLKYWDELGWQEIKERKVDAVEAKISAFMSFVESHGASLPCHPAVRKVQAEVRRSSGNTVQIESYKRSLLEAFEIDPVLSSGDGRLSLDLSWSPVCSHGSPGSGYTCGLWSLLHTLSVSVASSPSGKAFAEAVRGMVEMHFPCEECRMHFLAEYDGCEHGACDVEDGEQDGGRALLWLWRVHNSVARRVNEDEGIVWPTKEECGRCWGESMGEHEKEIVEFVTEYYGRGDEKRIKKRG